MKASDVRRKFLSFYQGNGHEVVSSASLIPHNDPTLFFVNAGMVPFKDVFTNKEERSYTRATSSQRCLRVSGKHNDLENVGRTPRHHTYFEMLGNFSFGDYFKKEAIEMAWELYTGELGMDPKRIWVTVYEDDDEAYDYWRSVVNFPEERLQRLGAKENFWSMGATGPCGPCSELHYDYGPSISSCSRGPAGESDRYVEFCNLVFMQFDQAADGSRVLLPKPSIDTGSGLERVTAILQGVSSNYDTDLFLPLIARGAEVSGIAPGASQESDVALKVIADHARATAFLIADGIMPSNEGRGYVLRRLMRRAIRFGVKIGVDKPFFHHLTDEVVRHNIVHYTELERAEAMIEEVVRGEEERFRRTLHRGMALLDQALTDVGQGGALDGEVAFTLSDTYGFPFDLTQQIAGERGATVDGTGFDVALERQKERGRAAWKGSGEAAVEGAWHRLSDKNGATIFSGYKAEDQEAEVVALLMKSADGLEEVDSIGMNQSGVVLFDTTPMYAESGGQMGDAGAVHWTGGEASVQDTTKAAGLHLHSATVTSGALTTGQKVSLSVDSVSRAATKRNHTATHLLHSALKACLGDHVNQKGSLVGPNRLRFDFSHHKPVTDDEVTAIELMVNEEVMQNTPVTTVLKSLDEAKADGATALFGEKYDAEVRVVAVGEFSKELCGGTHVSHTGEIGLFKIGSEGGIAAGVRRIEAQTGAGALEMVSKTNAQLNACAEELKVSSLEVVEAISRLKESRKSLEKQLESLQREIAKQAAGDLTQQTEEVNGVKVLVVRFDGDLKEQADRLRDQLKTAVIVLFGVKGAKVQVLIAATKDIAPSKVHAGNLIKLIAPLVGGRGGGRPDMAQAGGQDVAAIDTAIAEAKRIISEALA